MAEPTIKCIWITKIENSKLWSSYPANPKDTNLSQVKSICNSFKTQNTGWIQTKNENYFYSTYKSEGSFERFFFFLITEPKFKDDHANDFYSKLFDAWEQHNIKPRDSAEAISEHVISWVSAVFDCFKRNEDIPLNVLRVANRTDGLEKSQHLSQSSSAIELQDIDASNMNHKEENGKAKDKDKDKTKDKGKCKGKEQNKNQGSWDESTVKNSWINNEDNIDDEVNLDAIAPKNGTSNSSSLSSDEGELFMKDSAQWEKVSWWRKMKLIFIWICLVLAVGLYVAIPFWMKYKSNWDKETEELQRGQDVTPDAEAEDTEPETRLWRVSGSC